MRTATLIAFALLCSAGNGWAIEPSQVSGFARSIVRQIEAELPARLALTDVRVPSNLRGNSRSNVAITWRATPQQGQLSVLAVVSDGGRETSRGWVALKVASIQNVVIARRALRNGERISSVDLGRAERPVVDGEHPISLSTNSLEGLLILRDLAEGQLVAQDDVALPAPIARDTPVRIIAKRGAVVVTIHGNLERPARLGDIAEARTQIDRHVVTGRLVDRNTVEVGVDQ